MYIKIKSALEIVRDNLKYQHRRWSFEYRKALSAGMSMEDAMTKADESEYIKTDVKVTESTNAVPMGVLSHDECNQLEQSNNKTKR